MGRMEVGPRKRLSTKRAKGKNRDTAVATLALNR